VWAELAHHSQSLPLVDHRPAPRSPAEMEGDQHPRPDHRNDQQLHQQRVMGGQVTGRATPDAAGDHKLNAFHGIPVNPLEPSSRKQIPPLTLMPSHGSHNRPCCQGMAAHI
jgi:hypothetical protein